MTTGKCGHGTRSPERANTDPLTGHTAAVHSVSLGHVGGRPVAVSGSDDTTIRMWDAITGVPIGKALTGHSARVRSVSVSDIDGRPLIISASDDTTLRIWDAVTGIPINDPLKGHTGWVYTVLFGEVERHPVIISGGNDQAIRIWDAADVRNQSPSLTLSINVSASIYDIAISHSSTILAATELGIISLRVDWKGILHRQHR